MAGSERPMVGKKGGDGVDMGAMTVFGGEEALGMWVGLDLLEVLFRLANIFGLKHRFILLEQKNM